jgi:uncharacterized protein involved in exopolysaccharide biosynthesis
MPLFLLARTIQLSDGKLYVDKDILLAQYAQTSATPEAPKQRLSAVDNAIQALVSQLEAKDRQIDNLNERLREANYTIQTNAQKALAESNQSQTETKQEGGAAPNQDQTKSNTWLIFALIGLGTIVVVLFTWILLKPSEQLPVVTQPIKTPELPQDTVKAAQLSTDTTVTDVAAY